MSSMNYLVEMVTINLCISQANTNSIFIHIILIIYGICLSTKCWFLNNKFLFIIGENGSIRRFIDFTSSLWTNSKTWALEANWT